MLKRFLSFTKKEEHKSLFNNLTSLGLIHGTNILLPLLTFPYLVRVIGIENFGVVTLVQTVMSYFVILTDYGFNLSATKEISINNSDLDKVSSIFSEVMVTKLLLLLVCFVLLILTVQFSPFLKENWFLIFSSFFIVLGQVLQPVWFFHGVQEMKYLTYLNLLSKVVFTALIFSFINDKTDFIFVNFLNGLSATVAGLASLIIVFYRFKVKPRFVTGAGIVTQFKKGWSIFVSSVSITISNNTNIVILSFFADASIVGQYSIAEKVFLLTRTFAGVLYQAVYPNVCLLAQESFAKLANFLKLILRVIMAGFLPMCLLVLVFADFIILLIAGDYVPEAVTVLRILSFGSFFAALNIPASQTLLAYHLDKTYALIATAGAVLNVVTNIVLSYLYSGTGTALAVLITESGVTFMLYFILEKFHPQYSILKRNVKWS